MDPQYINGVPYFKYSLVGLIEEFAPERLITVRDDSVRMYFATVDDAKQFLDNFRSRVTDRFPGLTNLLHMKIHGISVYYSLEIRFLVHGCIIPPTAEIFVYE